MIMTYILPDKHFKYACMILLAFLHPLKLTHEKYTQGTTERQSDSYNKHSQLTDAWEKNKDLLLKSTKNF